MKQLTFFIFFFSFLGCYNDGGNKPLNGDTFGGVKIKYPLPSTVDSLFVLLSKIENDTNKINILNSISRKLSQINPDTSLILSNQALSIAQNLNTNKHKADSYHEIAWANFQQGNFDSSLQNNLKALNLRETLPDKSAISRSLGNIGLVYKSFGNLQKALTYYFEALKIDEGLKNKNGIARHLGNIGQVYSDQLELEKALDYFIRSLNISIEIDNKLLQTNNYGNIGLVYYKKHEYEKALDYSFKSLKLKEEAGNKNGISKTLGNIGIIYCDQGNIPKAFEFDKKALAIAVELGDKNGEAADLSNIGILNMLTGKYTEAFESIYQALSVQSSIGAVDGVKGCYWALSQLYEKSTIPLPDSIGGKMLNMEQMRLRSLHYYKSYVNLRDTLFSQENKKQLVRKEMNYEFDKKETQQKAEQDKKDALSKEELKQKEQQRNYFIAGFGLVLLLAGFIFRSYRQKQKANEIISHQKHLVEEKQKEILDSIHYAKRIQQSMMPTEKFIEKSLNRMKK